MDQQQTPQTSQGTRPAPTGARPGAMTMAMQAVQMRPSGPKVLRIGLFRGTKNIEERIIRKRETVSIGSSERNHFVIQAAGVPPRFDLFQLVGGDYILNFTDQMRGRVSLPAGVQELEKLRTSGAARNAGAYYQVKLTDNSRGMVKIGDDIRLMFQFVSPPPEQPRPQLPAAVRGGFAKSIDWVYTAFVLFSFMSHFGLLVYLENADWPIDQGISDIPESVRAMIFAEPPPPPEEPEQTAEGPAEPSQAKAETAPTKRSSSSDRADEQAANDVATNAEARARIAAEAAQAAEALLLGAFSNEGGALADVLAGGAVTGNAEDILAQAAGVGVAQGGAGGTLRTRAGGGSSGQTGSLGSLAAAGGAGATSARQEGGEVAERSVRGRINLEDGGDVGGSGEFDAAVVVRTIRTRLRAIQSCYEQQLRRNPTLAGKVTVQFTIEESGSVTGARATENTTGDSAVASCVVATVARFRFNPGPEGGSVSFSYPFVFAPQN